jgi:hypothetical protein
MIPKIFHRIWIGDNPIPEKHECWWQAWQRLHPDFSFMTWTEVEFEAEQAFCYLHVKVRETNILAMKSDIMRVAILYQYGGIYIDTDMMPINRIPESELNADFIICETNTAFLAARKHNKSLGVASHIFSMRDLSIGSSHNIISLTGPKFLDKVVGAYDHKLMPRHRFYPYNHDKSFSTLFLQDLGTVYGAHVWNGSWYPDVLEQSKHFGFFTQGNVIELEEGLLNGRGGEAYADVFKRQIEIVRDIRGRIIEAIHSSHLDDLYVFTEKSLAVFSAFKMCLFLQSMRKNISAWCIGSGNAVHNSHLSSEIAFFDMNTIFVEPNFYLKEKIESSFARNSNIQVIAKPFYLSGANIEINLVNPEEASKRNLPDWVSNLSYIQVEGRSLLETLHANGGEIALNLHPILEGCYESVVMQAIDTDDLLTLTHGEPPDILSIEASGMEGMILPNIFDKKIFPKILIVVNSGLCDGVVPFLENYGYVVVSQEGAPIFAIKKDFMTSYCDYLFLEYGIRSIYEQALETLFPELDERYTAM